MRKVTIALDIDGVVVDLVTAILPLLTNHCGRQIKYEDITCYDIGKALGIENKMSIIWPQIFQQTDLLLTAPPIKGAIDGIRQIQDHKVLFATSRPAVTKKVTERWLTEHGVEYDGIFFDANSNKIIAGQDINVLIEDNLEHVLKASEAGINSILLNHPWNRSSTLPTLCKRAYSWEEIITHIDYLFNEERDDR